jgi:hypothetical protein
MHKPYQGAVLASGLVVVALALLTGACAPAPVDLTRLPHCAHEWGPGPDGPVPCVWDTQIDGAVLPDGTDTSGGSPMRWLLYVDKCPVATVQPAERVECVSRADWSGQ